MSASSILFEIIDNSINNSNHTNISHIIKYDTDHIKNVIIKNETTFYDLFAKMINDNKIDDEKLIYEKRRTNFPLILSIKKEYIADISDIQIHAILKILKYNLNKYFKINNDTDNLVDNDNTLLFTIITETTDNYNIIFPNIILNEHIQSYIIGNILCQEKYILKIRNIFKFYKDNVYKIFDEVVYSKDYSWLLYGYKDINILCIYDSNLHKIDNNKYNELNLLLLVSMRKYKNDNSIIIENNCKKINDTTRQNKTKYIFDMRDKMKIYKNKDNKSHTYMSSKEAGQFGGCYYIADEILEDFYDIIHDYRTKNIEVYMVERRVKIHPLIIDLDIRQKQNERQYTDDTIYNFINIVNEVILFVYPTLDTTKLQSFILEKKYKESTANELYKDGLHIVYPYVTISYEIQLYIRHIILTYDTYYNKMKEIFYFNIVQNKSKTKNIFHDLYDDCIIGHPEISNGWFIYGCNKPNSNIYELKYILDNYNNKIDNTFKTRQLMTLLSMRNKTEIDTEINASILTDIENFKLTIDTPLNKQKTNILNSIDKVCPTELQDPTNTMTPKLNLITSLTINSKIGHESDLEDFIRPLVMDCLSEDRLEYNQWIRVCWCLYNIDHRLYPVFLDFTKKSSLFKEEDYCKSIWNNNHNSKDRDSKLLIGALIHWAKKDNYDQYYKLLWNNQTSLINRIALSGGNDHVSMRNLVYKYLNGFGSEDEIKYVCVKLEKQVIWYYFNNSRWELSDGDCIRNYMSENNTIKHLFQKELDKLVKQKNDIPPEDKNQLDAIDKNIGKYRNYMFNILCNSDYLKKVESSCRDIFVIKNDQFYHKLNDNPNLIGFNNGVYDLEKLKFRKMKGMDLITYTTGYDYDENIIHTSYYNDVVQFILTTLPNKDVREYLLKRLASFICGIKKDELLLVLRGKTGANGKSQLINLLNTAMGNYQDVLDISKLTQKRKSADSADPSLSGLIGVRIIISSEPDSDNEIINCGLLKEMTGGDMMRIRALYKDARSFKPQWSLVLVCNEYPAIPSSDEGTWRRIRAVEFTQKFTDDPNLLKKHKWCHPKDNELPDKVKTPEWGMAMMHILLSYFKKIKDEKFIINVPQEVLISTNSYKSDSDTFQTYIDKYLYYDKNDSEYLSIKAIQESYKNWLRNEEIIISNKNILKLDVLKDKVMKWYNEDIAPSFKLREYKNYPVKGLRFISIKEEDQLAEEEEEILFIEDENDLDNTIVNNSFVIIDNSNQNNIKEIKETPKNKSKKKHIEVDNHSSSDVETDDILSSSEDNIEVSSNEETDEETDDETEYETDSSEDTIDYTSNIIINNSSSDEKIKSL
jgi:P4 family phage/plasmid primase-like protien